MNNARTHGRRYAAFTLIEVLVVIAVIGILAALTLGVSNGVRKLRMIKTAQAELAQVSAAIEAYKARRGYFPPDNPANPALNPLYFELKGSRLTNPGGLPTYVTLDGASRIAASDLRTVFGPTVSGFMNLPKNSGPTDEDDGAVCFLKELRQNQIGQLVVGAETINTLLLCSARWTGAVQVVPTAGNPRATEPGLNPWRYVSSAPSHNANAYDLWVDLSIGGKTYRVSNWSAQPETL